MKEIKEWLLLFIGVPLLLGISFLVADWVGKHVLGWNFDDSFSLLFIITLFLGWVPLLFYSNAAKPSLVYGFLTIGVIVQRSVELLLKHVPALASYSDQRFEIVLITILALMLTYYLVWKHQTGRSNRAR